jgi:hypothetical protein
MAQYFYQFPFPSGANSATLAATEAKDVAAFNVNDANQAQLATTEARDTAAFNASDKNLASLATTESQDTAAFNVGSQQVALATTEALDVAAFAASDGSAAAAAFDYGGGGDYWVKEWLKRRRQARKEQEENERAAEAPRGSSQDPLTPLIAPPALGARTPKPLEPAGRTFAELRQALETDRALEWERMEQEDEEAVAYFVAHLEDA